jgi:hypothetical protein
MTTIDLYTGFETDREMIFTEKSSSNQIIFKIKLWYGYFDSIMRLIPLSNNAHPDSIIYNWQKVQGFYDDEIWECKRVQEFYNQLLQINDFSSEINLSDALNALKQICLSTIQNRDRLFIEYL